MSDTQAWVGGEADFDKMYRKEPEFAGAPVVFDKMPWDIGEAQPVVVRLADGARLRDRVLDVGCGHGDNSIFLAGRGYQVTGVDGSATAVASARERAAARGLEVEFVHANVTTLDGLEQAYGSVLDSALYHCLNQDERSAYAAALHRVTLPESSLHLFCFAEGHAGGFGGPNPVSQDDLHTHLDEHWDIRSIELATYIGAHDREFFEQHQAELGEMGIAIDPDAMEFDEQGRVCIPMWQLFAVRR